MEPRSSLSHTLQSHCPVPCLSCQLLHPLLHTSAVCRGWGGLPACVALLSQVCPQQPPVTAQGTQVFLPGPIQLFVVVAIFSLSMQYPIPLLPQLDNVP